MKVAVVGGYGVALTMRLDRFPADGETVLARSFAEIPGGKGSNQAIAAARLGAEVKLLTIIGDDSYGRAAQKLWRSEGVDAAAVATGTRATMVGSVLVDASGENRIVIAAGVLDEFTEGLIDSFRAEIAAADLLLVSMEIPLFAVLRALQVGAEVRTMTVLNPAPAVPLPAVAWNSFDVITPNQTEAPILLGLATRQRLSPTELIVRMRERTDAVIVLTLGAEGALVSTGRHVERVPAFAPRAVVDTTGAGDSFNAALSVALAAKLPLRVAVRQACAAGAWAVATDGVLAALPTSEDLEMFLQRQHDLAAASSDSSRPNPPQEARI